MSSQVDHGVHTPAAHEDVSAYTVPMGECAEVLLNLFMRMAFPILEGGQPRSPTALATACIVFSVRPRHNGVGSGVE